MSVRYVKYLIKFPDKKRKTKAVRILYQNAYDYVLRFFVWITLKYCIACTFATRSFEYNILIDVGLDITNK